MGSVIRLDDFRCEWRQVISARDGEGGSSSIQVHVCDRTGEVEIIQFNDEGESIRTVLSKDDASLMLAAFALRKRG